MGSSALTTAFMRPWSANPRSGGVCDASPPTDQMCGGIFFGEFHSGTTKHIAWYFMRRIRRAELAGSGTSVDFDKGFCFISALVRTASRTASNTNCSNDDLICLESTLMPACSPRVWGGQPSDARIAVRIRRPYIWSGLMGHCLMTPTAAPREMRAVGIGKLPTRIAVVMDTVGCDQAGRFGENVCSRCARRAPMGVFVCGSCVYSILEI